uniref:Uncharacterized protein n=1 Tax=Sphaerodactylus townsendi TaxID=933632 RepID=A0ACB8ES55_9SAUR
MWSMQPYQKLPATMWKAVPRIIVYGEFARNIVQCFVRICSGFSTGELLSQPRPEGVTEIICPKNGNERVNVALMYPKECLLQRKYWELPMAIPMQFSHRKKLTMLGL